MEKEIKIFDLNGNQIALKGKKKIINIALVDEQGFVEFAINMTFDEFISRLKERPS